MRKAVNIKSRPVEKTVIKEKSNNKAVIRKPKLEGK